DEAADLEAPRPLVEDRHRAGDRVDPPAADGQQVADELRERRRERRRDRVHLRGPGEGRKPSREEEQERAPAVGTCVVVAGLRLHLLQTLFAPSRYAVLKSIV